MNPTPTPDTPPVDIARLRELEAKATLGPCDPRWIRSFMAYGMSKADAECLAALRNAAPALLSEVESRRSQEKVLREDNETHVQRAYATERDATIAERDALRQENDRLLAEIEGLKAKPDIRHLTL